MVTNSSSRSRIERRWLIAVLGDRHAAHQLHHEVGPARFGRPGIEHLGDVRVIHQGQRLPLGLEAGDDLLGIHARLDDLERHLAPNRLRLLGHEDDAHAPFADLLQQLVGADDAYRGARRLKWSYGGTEAGASGLRRKLPAVLGSKSGSTSAAQARSSPEQASCQVSALR